MKKLILIATLMMCITSCTGQQKQNETETEIENKTDWEKEKLSGKVKLMQQKMYYYDDINKYYKITSQLILIKMVL